MPAQLAGVVPRAWRTVLGLALTARPGETILALVELLRGRRVRGWNLLSLAAARHRRYYAAWIAAAEPALQPAAPANPGLASPVSVGAVVIGGSSSVTGASLIAAFGRDMPIFDGTAPLPASRPAWLLPIRAGDRVAVALGSVLDAHLGEGAPTLIYWDEDRLDKGRRTEPWIKPDWDPILFGTHDGLIGSCLLRSDTLGEDPITDWTALAYALANGSDARHLPRILTHRAASRIAAPRQHVANPPVAISVIVPTRDRADLLQTCLDGLSRTHFPGEREIIVVDNDSRDPRTRALLAQLAASGAARVVPQHGPFDFAALCNAGVATAHGELVCLLNNDIEIIAPDWLEQMAAWAVRDEIGAVGARLLYPDGAIQHAGVAIGIGGAAGHVEKGALPQPGVFAPWHDETRTVSAVTAACLLVARDKFIAVDGMDAERFTIDFNDVDLCLRLAARGWRTVYCAAATLIHHESRSRGTTRHGADLARFERELAALRSRWDTRDVRDPYHNPLFRRQSERCLLAF
ncbi:glycosyltransferase [Sphingomonas sp. MMS24-J13]|uniref:glycosyltransferase family 2 protein n=1 Tax=Sphingomonas sp. MMS24-J13 TaxID=3238686 RepID=UPI00385046DE